MSPRAPRYIAIAAVLLLLALGIGGWDQVRQKWAAAHPTVKEVNEWLLPVTKASDSASVRKLLDREHIRYEYQPALTSPPYSVNSPPMLWADIRGVDHNFRAWTQKNIRIEITFDDADHVSSVLVTEEWVGF